MFNLEESIRNWRKSLQTAEGMEDGDKVELESHLRSRFEDLSAQGLSPESAFQTAAAEIGEPAAIGIENKFARERKHWQVSRAIFPVLIVNYMMVFTRSFRKNKLQNVINIAGLSIGITSCIFIAYYSLFELSYDRAYTNSSIYRVVNHRTSHDGIVEIDAGGPVPLGPTLQEEIPEIQQAVRFWRAYMPTITYNDKSFQERRFMYADSSVLELFGFKLLQGNPSDVLKLSNSVIVSESIARKYFGDDDPIGKVLLYDGYPGGKLSFMITGVFKDLPINTHFAFDFLASFESAQTNDAWKSFKPVWTYISLYDQADREVVERKLPAFIDKYLAIRKSEKELRFILEPVSSIHLSSSAGRPMKPGGNMQLIQILVLTGILILLMSCVNFINSSLAKAITRMKEIGVRKVLGAFPKQLLSQFITEVLVSLAICSVISLVLLGLLLPQFEDLSGFTFHSEFLLSPLFLCCVIGVLGVVTLLSGYFPGKILAAYPTLDSLRQKTKMSSNRKLDFKNILILFQLMIASMLILAVLIVSDQLQFIKDRDLGVDVKNVYAIPFSENPDAFESQVRQQKDVLELGYSQRLPVNTLAYDGRVVAIPGRRDVVPVESCFTSENFFKVYNIALMTGRVFLDNAVADSNKFVINATAMRAFGWNADNVLGQQITWSDHLTGEIVGVVKDFHLESIHETIPPMVMLKAVDEDTWQRKFISIKIGEADHQGTLATIESLWRSLNPQGAFTFVSMEDSFKQLHANDFQFESIISYFTYVAVFISAIGMFSLVSYAAEKKRKEIGIRKVLGSSVGRLSIKLCTPFIAITLGAFILAIPPVLYLMNDWLSTFAYHTSIKISTIMIAAGAIVLIMILSMAKQLVGAAFVNPVKYLRDE